MQVRQCSQIEGWHCSINSTQFMMMIAHKLKNYQVKMVVFVNSWGGWCGTAQRTQQSSQSTSCQRILKGVVLLSPASVAIYSLNCKIRLMSNILSCSKFKKLKGGLQSKMINSSWHANQNIMCSVWEVVWETVKIHHSAEQLTDWPDQLVHYHILHNGIQMKTSPNPNIRPIRDGRVGTSPETWIDPKLEYPWFQGPWLHPVMWRSKCSILRTLAPELIK